jgi:hypothetical protein
MPSGCGEVRLRPIKRLKIKLIAKHGDSGAQHRCASILAWDATQRSKARGEGTQIHLFGIPTGINLSVRRFQYFQNNIYE